MVPQTKNFENITVNIYEIGSFTKFAERDLDTNVFNDITKSNYRTSFFKPKEVKPHLSSRQHLEKLNVLHVNIRSIKSNFQNLKAVLEKCELAFDIIESKYFIGLKHRTTKQFESFSHGIQFYSLRKK